DLELLRRHHRRGSVRQLQDRRKDLYSLTFGVPLNGGPSVPLPEKGVPTK
ncbi:MAG: hypothetical protein QOJ26_1594, partial [Thermoplasmata archaeon]|nr:hypothetical protein [Thermoplasmata archaeon]